MHDQHHHQNMALIAGVTGGLIIRNQRELAQQQEIRVLQAGYMSQGHSAEIAEQLAYDYVVMRPLRLEEARREEARQARRVARREQVEGWRRAWATPVVPLVHSLLVSRDAPAS